MFLQLSSKSVVVPKGSYVLGDPCYVVPDADWDDLLFSCNYFNYPVGYANGFEVLAFGTKWGDGCYPDNFGNEYGVDAGLIGLVPVEYAQVEPDSVIVSFDEPTLCKDEDGILVFGKYRVDTVCEEVEED